MAIRKTAHPRSDCIPTSRQFTHTHTHINTQFSAHPFALLLLTTSIYPPVSHEELLLQGCGASAHKIRKKLFALMMEKPTPKKAKEKKCSRKKVLSWKASIFSRSELLVQAQSIPGCQSLSSFGSLALQFSFTSWLEASKAPLTLHTASRKEREREMETKKEGEGVKSSLSCKNNLWSHSWPRIGPCLFILCFSLCSSISLLCLLHFLMCFSSRSKMLVII